MSSPKRWPVHDAKARFSALLDATLAEGPQIVTKRGADAAVLVPIDTWRQMDASAPMTLKELLLAETPRGEIPVVPRRRARRRTPKRLA